VFWSYHYKQTSFQKKWSQKLIYLEKISKKGAKLIETDPLQPRFDVETSNIKGNRSVLVGYCG